MQHQIKEIKSVGNSRELYRSALTGLLIYNSSKHSYYSRIMLNEDN
jgi:hypothetical protein